MKRLWRRYCCPPGHVHEHPFEFAVAFAAVISGLAQLITDNPPSSISMLLNPSFQRAWSLYLLVGGLLIVLGILARNDLHPLAGIRTERLGLVLLAPGALVYCGAVLSSVGLGGLFVALTYGLYAFACYLRLRQIDRYVATLEVVRD